ncbi:hypothetical protein CH92_04725 [Stutzerimonas stutzeri]|uniref:DUF748 domain-containing protein n=1 Tax=Stutzerimonas stutzeri TaxID=316 RepID=W8R7V9_STUST|nr:DUF748 domain-containing protein [Stutzerimonas stutzeri]AHL74427.1 hypothetical protein CH92_04725 [Stutzerimonas stutzeri]MCQ4328954.1 DUF748 domain-containing protein [Stutzerimonas stutzeri]
MPNGMKRALIGLMTALVCYCLLGFLILPGVAQRIVNQQLIQYATVPARLERIEFNPFSLELTLFNLRLGEAEQPQLGFERLYLNLQWSSLWRRALQIEDIELVQLHTEVVFDKDGVLNLTQLFDLPVAEEQPDEAEQEPFALRIGRLQLVEGSVHFADQRPDEPIDFLLDSLDFELMNFATRSDDAADAVLVATGPSGARVDWTGQINLSPISSSGQLKISDLLLKDFWAYAQDAVPLRLQEGRLSFSSDYRLDLAQSTELQLSNLNAQLAPLKLDTPDGQPLVRLESLEISNTSLDLAKQQVVIGELRSRALETWVAREPDGELNWLKLLAPSTTLEASQNPDRTQSVEQSPEPTPSPTAADSSATAKSAWQVLLRDAQLRDYRIHLSDRVPEGSVALELGPLNLDVSDFDSLGTRPFKLDLNTRVGNQGVLQAAGQLQLQPAAGQLKISTQDIDLRIAQAYLTPLIHLELRSGMLASQLDLELTGTEPLAFNLGGTAEITQLHTLDTIKNRDFVKWQRLKLDGLKYQHPQQLQVEHIELSQPYARFIINPDLTTNINDLLVDKSTPDDREATSAATEPMSIQIGGIAIDNGSANFSDLSLRPPFITAVQELNGQIGTIDNRAQQPATVDVEGKVDRYAPVSIKGNLTPFDPLQSLDIVTRFRQVELTTLSPYSGKFAGYRIRKGRLDLDLHYRIQQGQLNAENKVVLQQLQLGEKVDSPEAVDLPVRLAVALLKDSHGTISLELPVQGNLNSPQFDVMPIVWQTLRNLVTRAVQAPFKFLAGLAGGEQNDLSQVLFAPGNSELDEQARGNLSTLARALQERPVLRLEVEGQSSPQADGPLIAEQWLQREFQETWYKVLQRRGDKVPADAAQLEIGEEEKDAMLEGIYRSRLGQQPPAQWSELDEQERSKRMRDAVVASRADSTALLRSLSRARAASIKDYLVDQSGLEDSRVYLLDTGITQTEEAGRIPTSLHLGSE